MSLQKYKQNPITVEFSDKIRNICTVLYLQTFFKWIMIDLVNMPGIKLLPQIKEFEMEIAYKHLTY